MEHVEDLRQVLGRDADAGVPHLHVEHGGRRSVEAHRTVTAPRLVNLSALPIRLRTTIFSFTGSVRTRSVLRGTSQRSITPGCAAAGRSRAAAR